MAPKLADLAPPSRPAGRVGRELTECAAGPEWPFGCGPLADASLSVVHRGGHRGHGRGANAFTTEEVAVDADAAEVPVGIASETVMMAWSVVPSGRRRCGAGCPKTGPDRPSKPAIDWPMLRQLASVRALPAGSRARI